MKNQYLLALDGGSGSFRAIVFDTQGKQLFVEQVKWEHLEDPDIPGSMSFAYEENWVLISECIQNIIRKNNINPEEILGVATTTMREGFVLYNEAGEELIGFANVDSRSVEESAFLKREYPDLEETLFEMSGESFALGALPRLLWVKNHRTDLMEQAHSLNMLNDWISYKLSGVLASEPSNSSTTGIFNIKERQWELEPLQEFGIHLHEVPVIESGDFLGHVSEEASKATGLSTNTKVIMGGGDAQLGCLGIGVTDENETALLGGSFWQFNHNIRSLNDDFDYYTRINCHAMPNMWQYELIAWQVGFTTDWFIDAFFTEDIKRLGSRHLIYDYLNENVVNIPAGSNGMMALFTNEMNMMNLKNAAPTFTNFQLDSADFNRFTFYKAIMEGVAVVLSEHKTRIEANTSNKIESLVFAGGASNNEVWCQIIADMLGIPIKVPVIKEATAFGAAMLAGIGCGVYDNSTVADLVQFEKTYEPNMTNHEIYQDYKQKWRAVYNAQLALTDQGLTTSMWRAPGI